MILCERCLRQLPRFRKNPEHPSGTRCDTCENVYMHIYVAYFNCRRWAWIKPGADTALRMATEDP